MVASPPLVSVYKSAAADGVAPSVASAVFKAGDWVYVTAFTASSEHKLGTPTGPPVGSPGWTLLNKQELPDFSSTYGWYAKVTADWTGTISVPISVQGIAGYKHALFRAYRYDSRSAGLGAVTASYGEAAPSLSLTTQREDSTILWLAADWNAQAWSAAPSFRVPSGSSAAINDGHAHLTSCNYVFGRHDDAGPAGAKVVGLTTPTFKYSMVGIEVLGDITLPSGVPNIQVVLQSDTSVTVTWDAATDNAGIASYKVYRDGVEIATVLSANPRSYTNVGLKSETTYQYTVRAVDTSGNLGSVLTSKTITTPMQKVKLGSSKVEFRLGSKLVSEIYLGSNRIL